MKTKYVSVLAFLLGVCTLAIAAEYKSPDVKLKKAEPSYKEAQTAEFSEEYKVEGVVKTDRQIASEEESDREPSSVKAESKKKINPPMVEEPKEEEIMPKPWMYGNKTESNY